MTDLSAPEAPAAGGPRRTFMRRRKVCPLKEQSPRESRKILSRRHRKVLALVIDRFLALAETGFAKRSRWRLDHLHRQFRLLL